MSNLVERLQDISKKAGTFRLDCTIWEAADRITSLEAEVERLKRLAYSPHTGKNDEPLSWFAVCGKYNARASDADDRAETAAAALAKVTAERDALQLTVDIAADNMTDARNKYHAMKAVVEAAKEIDSDWLVALLSGTPFDSYNKKFIAEQLHKAVDLNVAVYALTEGDG